MKRTQKKTKPRSATKLVMVNFKATVEEHAILKRQAKKHANGFVSQYIRMKTIEPFKATG